MRLLAKISGWLGMAIVLAMLFLVYGYWVQYPALSSFAIFILFLPEIVVSLVFLVMLCVLSGVAEAAAKQQEEARQDEFFDVIT